MNDKLYTVTVHLPVPVSVWATTGPIAIQKAVDYVADHGINKEELAAALIRIEQDGVMYPDSFAQVERIQQITNGNLEEA